MKRVWGAAGLAALALGGVAWAQDGATPDAVAGPPPGQRLALTIYNQDLALVEDVRTVTLPAGRGRQEFPGVSAQIRPETVSLTGPGIEVVEQNFDFDLLSPDSLMQNAVGQEVRIVRTNPGNGQETTERATVLAVNNGVVLRIGDRIEILRQDSVPTRVIFDRVPPNMRARPTLSVTVDSAQAGPRETRLSYLTSGLGWRADYVALFDEASGRMNLQGWITLTNTSGTTYSNADLRLVAGQIQTLDQENQYRYRPPPPPGRGGTESGEGGQALGDVYLYPLPERVTVAQNQTKQVGFLDVQNAQARRAYVFRASGFQSMEAPRSADSVLAFSNARAAGLAAQLPAGVVRVYQRDRSGTPQFVGENRIAHTPQGSDVQVKVGDAFDVTVQSRLVRAETLGPRHQRTTMEYVVRNARPQPVTVEVLQYGLWLNHTMTRESLRSERVDTSTRSWAVPVPANGETTLSFAVETRQ